MTNELSKNLYCIQMRSGIEIWVEKEKADKLQNELLTGSGSRFIAFEDNTFNTADIVGIFPAREMENLTRRKNGGWQCSLGTWHNKGERCLCESEEQKRQKKERDEEYYNEHGYYPL